MSQAFDWIERLPEPLHPIRDLARRLMGPDAIIDPISKAICLSYRPKAYGLRLFPGVDDATIDSYETINRVSIPQHYRAVLRHLNGAYIFNIALSGLNPFRTADPPELFRSTSWPVDIAANSFSTSAGLMIASEVFSECETPCYFMTSTGEINSSLEGGPTLNRWTGLCDFLADELSRAEARYRNHKEEFDDSLLIDGSSETEDEIRSAPDVARRCIVLYAVVAAGHNEPRRKLVKWLRDEGLWADVSPEEADFLKALRPKRQAIINASWRAEALYALAWALDLIDEFPAPAALCDVPKLQGALPPIYTSMTDFISNAKLRSEEEIAEALDATYSAHWEVRDAQLKNRPIPNGLNPGVLQERHHALNWLTGYFSAAWDDVTTDT